LALKINVKLGGINGVVSDSALDTMKRTPTMFLGADVTHPGPGVHNRPSVASLTWSTDRDFALYNTASAVQEPRTEIIASLQAMVEHALLDFAKKNKDTMPRIMVMYRDGVSEGEYERVKNEECAAIQGAINSVWMDAPRDDHGNTPPQPQIVFMVVGKRHHIRLFPQIEPQGRKGGGNCPPGILVDEELRSPYAQDFYLLSHGGLKGTSVPAHYIVLKNEPGIPLNIIQQFSYALCYSYHRATRAVSIPAPVYYADLVCGHAEFQFDSHLLLTDETSTSNSDTFDLGMWRAGFKHINPTLRERFYFL
jgi:eukaryotic translation initiation factor 2C